jgi:hypothetical protein
VVIEHPAVIHITVNTKAPGIYAGIFVAAGIALLNWCWWVWFCEDAKEIGNVHGFIDLSSF